jgi:hypothetical protein
MRAKDFPLLIEVTDKRFVLVSYIVGRLVLTPLGAEIDDAPDRRRTKKQMADYLYHWMPEKVLDYYVECCDRPSAKVKRTLNALKCRLVWRDDSDGSFWSTRYDREGFRAAKNCCSCR